MQNINPPIDEGPLLLLTVSTRALIGSPGPQRAREREREKGTRSQQAT